MTQEEALDTFEYKDGSLYSKIERGNRKHKVGDFVGNINNTGYYRFEYKNRKKFLVHRVIYLMHNGYMPQFIDHIDGNPLNNKIENLRPATKAQNCRNRGKSKTNKSGYKGVNWHKPNKKWVAKIRANDKNIHLGYFEDIELAHIAYSKAALFYHKEFAHE